MSERAKEAQGKEARRTMRVLTMLRRSVSEWCSAESRGGTHSKGYAESHTARPEVAPKSTAYMLGISERVFPVLASSCCTRYS
jgi:hypothetical protein